MMNGGGLFLRLENLLLRGNTNHIDFYNSMNLVHMVMKFSDQQLFILRFNHNSRRELFYARGAKLLLPCG